MEQNCSNCSALGHGKVKIKIVEQSGVSFPRSSPSPELLALLRYQSHRIVTTDPHCTHWTFNNMEDQCWIKTPGFRIFPITYDNYVRENVYSGARQCGHTEGEVLEDTRTGKDHT